MNRDGRDTTPVQVKVTDDEKGTNDVQYVQYWKTPRPGHRFEVGRWQSLEEKYFPNQVTDISEDHLQLFQNISAQTVPHESKPRVGRSNSLIPPQQRMETLQLPGRRYSINSDSSVLSSASSMSSLWNNQDPGERRPSPQFFHPNREARNYEGGGVGADIFKWNLVRDGEERGGMRDIEEDTQLDEGCYDGKMYGLEPGLGNESFGGGDGYMRRSSTISDYERRSSGIESDYERRYSVDSYRKSGSFSLDRRRSSGMSWDERRLSMMSDERRESNLSEDRLGQMIQDDRHGGTVLEEGRENTWSNERIESSSRADRRWSTMSGERRWSTMSDDRRWSTLYDERLEGDWRGSNYSEENRRWSTVLDDRGGSTLLDDRRGSNLSDDRRGSNLVDDRRGSNLVDDRRGSILADDRRGSNLADDRRGSNLADDRRGSTICEGRWVNSMLNVRRDSLYQEDGQAGGRGWDSNLKEGGGGQDFLKDVQHIRIHETGCEGKDGEIPELIENQLTIKAGCEIGHSDICPCDHICPDSGQACPGSGQACPGSGQACPGSGQACPVNGQACTVSGQACTGKDVCTADNTAPPRIQNIHEWLKSLRLHKYSQYFQHLTYEDLLRLTEPELEQLNITKGARRKILSSIQKLRERTDTLQNINNILEKSDCDMRQLISELEIILKSPMPNSKPGLKKKEELGAGEGVEKREFYKEDDKRRKSQEELDSVTLEKEKERKTTEESNELADLICLTLRRVCTNLLLSPCTDSSNVTKFVSLLDMCMNSEIFTQLQKQLLLSWKLKIRSIWHPAPLRRSSLQYSRRPSFQPSQALGRRLSLQTRSQFFTTVACRGVTQGTGRETLVRSNTTIVPTLPQRDQVLRAALMSPGLSGEGGGYILQGEKTQVGMGWDGLDPVSRFLPGVPLDFVRIPGNHIPSDPSWYPVPPAHTRIQPVQDPRFQSSQELIPGFSPTQTALLGSKPINSSLPCGLRTVQDLPQSFWISAHDPSLGYRPVQDSGRMLLEHGARSMEPGYSTGIGGFQRIEPRLLDQVKCRDTESCGNIVDISSSKEFSKPGEFGDGPCQRQDPSSRSSDGRADLGGLNRMRLDSGTQAYILQEQKKNQLKQSSHEHSCVDNIYETKDSRKGMPLHTGSPTKDELSRGRHDEVRLAGVPEDAREPETSKPSGQFKLVISSPDNRMPQMFSHNMAPSQAIQNTHCERAGPVPLPVQTSSSPPAPKETGLKPVSAENGETKIDSDLESICLSVTRHALE